MILKKRQRSPLFPEFHQQQLNSEIPGTTAIVRTFPLHSGVIVHFNHSIYLATIPL
ncbi:hypothetical protein PAECIP111893_03334 [Paenibacillus plantiphilus]|uniref:Uncharacterized protein n=1 Tax=Paenibacillus plantiphilus TaxID=2905650 RepID=A0ABN8GPN9_9BACL|nr:hypothetical protein [Paenibacillus plantiphilus]CAH1210944.1 hypothetical protein PAECIP111893_03334 [Paenibacillus plantiphilus]